MGPIKFGLRWPDYDLPIEREAVRDFVQAAEEMGFDHITIMDHLVGMDDETLGHRSGFTDEMGWGESLTMMTFMAGLSESIGFLTSIFVLPAKATVLVAKQISTLDNLSKGRFRLGVSIGWNHVEFALMGANFANRAGRYEEQIDVLRTLWSKSPVSYKGKWHDIPMVTMNPLPVQRPVPIWMGMSFDPPPVVLDRVARLADGFLPPWQPGDDRARTHIEDIYRRAEALGRDTASIGFEGRINLRQGSGQGTFDSPKKSDEELEAQIKEWIDLGATHIEFKTRGTKLNGLDEHLKEIARFKQVADAVSS